MNHIKRRSKPQLNLAQRRRTYRWASGPTARTGSPLGAKAHRFASLVSRHRGTALIALAVAYTILTWPGTQLAPQSGLDQSWQAGLAMALEKHIQWGPRIDFTYGPLGFLVVPMLYYHLTAALSLTYLAASRWLLYLLLLRECLRKLPWPTALALSFLVGATAIAVVDGADLLMASALLLYVSWQHSEGSTKRRNLLAHVLFPAFAAMGTLVKFSVGLLAVFLLAVIVTQSTRWRRAAITSVLSYSASFLLLWVATGNSPANIWQYVRLSVSVASGYSGAMSLEVGRTDEWLYALIFLAALGLLLRWGAATTASRQPWATWLAYAGFSWIALKEGFVRHDGHDLEFFGLMSVALLSVPWHRLATASRLLPTTALASILTWTAAGSVPSNVVSLATGPHSFEGEASAALGSRGTTIMRQAQAALVSTYALPQSMLAQMAGHTVAIEPYENTVAWAYPQLHWDPEPVLQQYSAYTSSLDALNTQFLRSPSAPKFILNQPSVAYEGINQDPYFESPSADLQMLCDYRQVAATPQWQLLRRGPDLCGAPRLLRTTPASFGSRVAVPSPPPHALLVAALSEVGTALTYRAENLLLKARAIQMTTNVASFRFVAGTATDLHVLSTPSHFGYSPQYLPPRIQSFTLYERNIVTDGGRYTVRFYAVPLPRLSSGTA